jgi:hypothetical protein
MFSAGIADTSDMAIKQAELEDLAEDLTRVLSIPFKATSRGSITFRDPLRVTDWSVPLVFDGHCRLDGGLVPTTFAGHVLWAALRSTKKADETRAWWTCTLTPAAAAAIIESVEVEELEGWAIGVDVLLDEVEVVHELASVSPIRIAS